jgi:hypothetical protein
MYLDVQTDLIQFKFRLYPRNDKEKNDDGTIGTHPKQLSMRKKKRKDPSQ